jgi:hypothetical protein
MARDFKLVTNFQGYVTKPDKTNTNVRHMVDGSQNMLVNDAEMVESRLGYTLDGASSTATTPIESSYDWLTSGAGERNLRSYDDELECRFVDAAGDVNWVKVADGWSAVDFVFSSYWDSAETQDVLIFVNGDANIYEWGGGIAEVASTTSNTITKEGSTSWADSHFYVAGNKNIEINGTTYAYTGGETTTTLTGVTPDPTGEANGSFATQTVITNSNKPAATSKNDVISVLNNQAYVGSNTSRTLSVSKTTDYTDFAASSPRVPGEGATLTLDSYVVGLAPQEDVMYISGGKDDWYKVVFNLSDDNTKENLGIVKLKTSGLQGAVSHDLITKAKNNVVFISNEDTLDELGRLENFDTPQSKDLSDPIKPDFDAATFTNGHIKYWKNQIFVALPSDAKAYIYDISKGFWQPPLIIPVRRWSVIGGEIYFHSKTNPETYKLFSGTDDNGAPISFKAKFAYRNFGDRASQKVLDEYYSELYVNSFVDVVLSLDYDYNGATSTREFTFDTSDDDYKFDAALDSGLGKAGLGQEPLGSSTVSLDTLAKYRRITPTGSVPFYELQVTYSSDVQDGRFKILAHGPNARRSKNLGINIIG